MLAVERRLDVHPSDMGIRNDPSHALSLMTILKKDNPSLSSRDPTSSTAKTVVTSMEDSRDLIGLMFGLTLVVEVVVDSVSSWKNKPVYL